MTAWLAENSDALVLSSIVLAELKFFVGIQPEGKRRDSAERILNAIDAGVGSRFADFDSVDAGAYGALMTKMRSAGTPIPAIDGLIAAQALARGYALATRNVRDFERTGVKVINPWEG